MAPDLLGRPDPMIDNPGSTSKAGIVQIGDDVLTRIWKIMPLKRDKLRGLPAMRQAIERIVKGRACSVDEAETYLADQVKVYAKYAGPYLARRSSAGLDSGKVMYPQGWFNGNHFEDDESTWRLTFGVPPHVENAEQAELAERAKRREDSEHRRRFLIEVEHQRSVLSSLSIAERESIIEAYREYRRTSGTPLSEFDRWTLNEHGLKSPNAWSWAIANRRIPGPDYSQGAES